MTHIPDVVEISIEKLLFWVPNPFEINPWPCNGLISKVEITTAAGIAQPVNRNLKEYATREYHTGRIAYLVRQGWQEPIDIDVGVPGFGFPSEVLQDGWHRLAAAIFLCKREILTRWSGSEAVVRELLAPAENHKEVEAC